MAGGQGLSDGFVLPKGCWVQRGKGLLNKTLSALTCGLFLFCSWEMQNRGRDACSRVIPQQKAPQACTLLETMFKALGEPWWDCGWAWGK